MTEQDDALVDQLRYTHEWGIFQAQEDAMLPSFEECADRIEALSAEVERLKKAATDFYMAGWWICNKIVDEVALWEALCDVIGLPVGTETVCAALEASHENR